MDRGKRTWVGRSSGVWHELSGVEKASLEIKGKVKVCSVLKTAELTLPGS